MRLTLRTLLAWLDDTLSPGEVREIGKQVNESPFAKDLVERISKVTRQRRLTVPPWGGADGTDPNLVAGYLDNELDPEQVAEFERKCLTSDVHLSEVASTHQILSLIGQKAKVPTEARQRMYHLVKGREATHVRTLHPEKEEHAPVAQPTQPWVTPPPPRRSAVKRFGPLAGVLGVILTLLWSAWSTLTPPESGKTRTRPVARQAVKPAQDQAETPVAPAPVAEVAAAKPDAADATKKDAAKDAAKSTATPAPADIPTGFIALAKKPKGLLLRYNAGLRDWERLTENTPLKDGDRVLNLDPYRSSVELGQGTIDLVGETEVTLRPVGDTESSKVALTRGRLVLHASPSALPFEISVGEAAATVTPPAGGSVGVERVNARDPGKAEASPPSLAVYVTKGSAAFGAGAAATTVDGPAAVTVGAGGKPTDTGAKDVPAWASETGPTPLDEKLGEQFLQFFRAESPILKSLVEASEDEQKDVCRLAITALKAVGDVSDVVPLLNKRVGSSASTARRAAIAVLRSYLAEGPDSAKALRRQLDRDLGPDLAATTEKLLVGYTPKEAEDEATYSQLVQHLATADESEVCVRELALDDLRQLTGRDSLDYDPEKPAAGKGLQAWKTLLRDHQLKPAAAGGDKK